MNNQDDIHFKNLITRLGLNEPVPADLRHYIGGAKNKNLVEILKKSGRYGIIIKLILALMYFIRKSGISVSFHQSCIVFCAVSILTISGITAGSYVVIQKAMEIYVKKHIEPISFPAERMNSRTIPFQNGQKTAAAHAQHCGSNKICMGTIENVNTDMAVADEIILSIKRHLAHIHGPQNLSDKTDTNNVPYALTGSITEINGTYIISVKIIDRRESKIIYMTSRNIPHKNALDGSCKEIAADISGAVK